MPVKSMRMGWTTRAERCTDMVLVPKFKNEMSFDLSGRKMVPIPFVPELVLKILSGEKTETRRLVRGHTRFDSFYLDRDGRLVGVRKTRESFNRQSIPGDTQIIKKPYEVGDVLWVKENWAAGEFFDDRPPRLVWEVKGRRYLSPPPVWYRADGDCSWPDELAMKRLPEVVSNRGKWRSSMFMCKWMARLFLDVEKVWAERVQDITHQGAVAEGFPEDVPIELLNDYGTGSATKDLFAQKWDEINKKRGASWERNPWVRVVRFQVIPAEKKDIIAWVNRSVDKLTGTY